jgi:membrane protein
VGKLRDEHDVARAHQTHRSRNDERRCAGLASQLAYYFFLALFPALLCFLAIASFFPLQNFTDDVIRLLGPVAPREILTLIKQQMVQIAKGNHGGLATVGLLGALWSSSAPWSRVSAR